MMDAASAMASNAQQLSRACQNILRGQGAMTQSAVLADLLSLWLAGHVVFGVDKKPDRRRTKKERERLLADFIKLVRDLVPESEKEIMQRVTPKGTG